MRPRIGLSIMLLETRREAIIDLATEGDRLGYDGFFMPEAWGHDMTVLLAEATARVVLIYLLPVDVMAVVSTALHVGALGLLACWLLWYRGRRQRELFAAWELFAGNR